MLSKNVAIALIVVLAAVCLAEARDESPHDMADALRMLQELDRYYTQAARPRIDRRDVGDEDRVDPDLLDRAVRLLQLQNLDRIYSYHTRPRYGKRSGSESYTNWAKDLEVSFNTYISKVYLEEIAFSDKAADCVSLKPDLPSWLAYARRR